eukprot:COSAG02_NODE_745_length_17738_cov_18.178241_14_plen_655_part_00
MNCSGAAVARRPAGICATWRAGLPDVWLARAGSVATEAQARSSNCGAMARRSRQQLGTCGRRLAPIAAHLVGGDAGKKNSTKKKPQDKAVPPEQLLMQVQGEWQDQHGTVIEIVGEEAVVHQRGRAKRWPISARGHTLFFGGSVLALPHDVDAPQWIFDDGPTMTWSRLPTIEEFAERLAPVEDFQTQEREVFFGRRGLQLTHIVLFGDRSADSHEATIAAMTEAYARYRGRAINIFIDVSVRKNAQVIRHFGLLPPGEPGLRLRSQDFPQVRAMDNGEDGQKNQLDKPRSRLFDPTVAAHYVEFVEQLGLIEEDKNNEGTGTDDDLLMDQLLEVAMLDTRPIVMLDAILPGQTMRLQIADAPHRAMVAKCLEIGFESHGFGMVGIDQRTRAPLMYGTEVRITECSANSVADMHAAGTASAPIHIRVQGYRAFRVEGKPWRETDRQEDGGFTVARVRWIDFELDSDSARIAASSNGNGSLAADAQVEADDDDLVVIGDEEEEEESDGDDERRGFIADTTAKAVSPDGGSQYDGADIAQDELDELEAEQLALAIDSGALALLVDEWCDLVRSGAHEKQDGQLDAILSDLGQMPPASSPGTRAVWVAALINPLPGLGVAWEIRPAMLAATSAVERVEVAVAGIEASIQNLRGATAR